MASLVAQTAKRLFAVRETRVPSLGWEDPLETEMAIHSSSLAWKIPWMEAPRRLQPVGLQRVRHHWATSLLLYWRVTFSNKQWAIISFLNTDFQNGSFYFLNVYQIRKKKVFKLLFFKIFLKTVSRVQMMGWRKDIRRTSVTRVDTRSFRATDKSRLALFLPLESKKRLSKT